MTLYHFTRRDLFLQIARSGILRGMIYWIGMRPVAPAVWLTTDERFTAQHWATNRTGSCGDRTEVRLALEVPDCLEAPDAGLWRWNDFALQCMHATRQELRYFNEEGGSDGERWFVKLGDLPFVPGTVRGVTFKPGLLQPRGAVLRIQGANT